MSILRYNPEAIELTEDGRRLIKQFKPLAPFSHEEILDLCIMTQDAFEEEVDNEFARLDYLRGETGSMAEALRDPMFARFESVALARMMQRLSSVALGGPPTSAYLVD